MLQVKKGIWTPQAKVVCYSCHGETFNYGLYPKKLTDTEMILQSRAVPLIEGNGITNCDDCGTAIQVIECVAAEHRLVAILQSEGIDASMAQTGGMNSACEIHTRYGYALVTYGVGYENDDEEPSYWYGEYDSNGEPEDIHIYAKSENQMVDLIKARLNENAIQKCPTEV